MHGFSANKLLECVDAQMFAIIIDLKLRKVFCHPQFVGERQKTNFV